MNRVTHHNVEGRVIGVCVGTVQPLRARGRVHQTAFVKKPAAGPVALSALGLEGDEHIFPEHGGGDQTLLVYSVDHYPVYESEYQIDLPTAGAFGENLSVSGLTETEVFIGDTFRIGEVVAQVTSPRSPCYKIGLRYDRSELPVNMQDTCRTGYLMRTITEGPLKAGDPISLIDRPTETLTVAEAARVFNRDRDDWEVIERLIAIPELADAMREKLQTRLATQDTGSDDYRLYGKGEGVPDV